MQVAIETGAKKVAPKKKGVLRSITLRPKLTAAKEKLFLPVCATARIFCAIGRSGVLDITTIQLIETLGYSVQYLS